MCLIQAEGKVDNYIDLANIGPYPSKNAPQERVEYTDVIPSSVSNIHYTGTHARARAHTHTHTHTQHTHAYIVA